MNPRPKIALIITNEGLECVTLLANDESSRKIALQLTQLLQAEITSFDQAVKSKLNSHNQNLT